MKFLDPNTESAVRAFLARLPVDLRLEYAILYGSRARGEDRPDSDADLALILAEGEADWDLVGDLAELASDVYIERGILVQPVPISLRHWLNPERFPRPGFLRNVARDGIENRIISASEFARQDQTAFYAGMVGGWAVYSRAVPPSLRRPTLRVVVIATAEIH